MKDWMFKVFGALCLMLGAGFWAVVALVIAKIAT